MGQDQRNQYWMLIVFLPSDDTAIKTGMMLFWKSMRTFRKSDAEMLLSSLGKSEFKIDRSDVENCSVPRKNDQMKPNFEIPFGTHFPYIKDNYQTQFKSLHL